MHSKAFSVAIFYNWKTKPILRTYTFGGRVKTKMHCIYKAYLWERRFRWFETGECNKSSAMVFHCSFLGVCSVYKRLIYLNVMYTIWIGFWFACESRYSVHCSHRKGLKRRRSRDRSYEFFPPFCITTLYFPYTVFLLAYKSWTSLSILKNPQSAEYTLLQTLRESVIFLSVNFTGRIHGEKGYGGYGISYFANCHSKSMHMLKFIPLLCNLTYNNFPFIHQLTAGA